MKGRNLLTCFCFLLGVVIVASAQVQTGTITGIVKDPAGAVIPGATVTVRNMKTNVAHTTTTAAKGTYTVAGLVYGDYSVTIEMDGFRRWETFNVAVVTGQVSVVNAELIVGSVTETVTVEAGQEVIDTVSTEIRANIPQKAIIDLPLIGRNPTNLVGLLAGVTSTSGSVRQSHFMGMREQAVNLTQDGINAMDNYVKTSGVFAITSPTVESVGEFSVSGQNIASESGFGVTQINMATPRGTNEYHGSVFYFHRNDKLNAAEFFDNIDGRKADGTPVTPKEREREHRFGFAVGGSLYIPGVVDARDNTFWFFRYEGFRENASTNRNRVVMTDSARQGLFSYVAGSAGTHPQTGLPFNAGDTVTVNLITLSDRFTGAAICGNAFCPAITSTNPFTMSLIDATPLPNNFQIGDGLNTGGHRFTVTEAAERNRYAFRADQKIVESDRYGSHWAEVDYSWVSFSNKPDTFNGLEAEFPEGVAVSCVGGVCEGASQVSERKLFAAAIHSTFGATIFNEARFGFNRAPVGFTRDNPFPRAFRVDFDTIQTPEQNFLSQGRQTPVYQFNENFTKVAGSHTVKLGGQIMSVSAVSFNDSGIIPIVDLNAGQLNPHGLSDSSGQFPGSGSGDRSRARNLYEMLTGLVDDSAQTFNGIPGQSTMTPGLSNELWLRERSFSAYLQDTWRARHNLTVNAGVRYEVIRPVDVVNKRAVMPVGGPDAVFVSSRTIFDIDPSVTMADLFSGAVGAGQVAPAGTSNGVPFWKTDWNNLAPFAGVAWSVNPKTVIRAGGSVSYTREGFTVTTNAFGNNPGLRQSLTDANIHLTTGSAVLDPSANYALAPPLLRFPGDHMTNFANTGNGMFTIDTELRTPYVIQWSFGIQRELSPSMALEVRYVGNHSVKLIRGIDVNQIDLISNGMLNEFFLAQQNLACNRSMGAGSRWDNLGFSCSVAMPVLDGMGFFTSSSRIGNLDRNEAGEFIHQVQFNCAFFRLNGFSTICPGMDALPANFFRTNPFGSFMDIVTNNAAGNYHGLQVELRRRFASGLMFGANYTYSKALSDSPAGSQSEFDPALDIRQVGFDYRRADWDVRHHFNFGGVWEIPVGRGRRYASEGVVGKILEGWQIGAINVWRAGGPFGIFSNRGTLNRSGRSSGRNPALLLSGTAEDVCNAVGIFKEDEGVFFLPPEFRQGPSGRATTTIFGHPGAGQLGTQPLRANCNRTGFFSLDLNLLKRTYFTESANVEFRFEVFNVGNHPNFQPGSSQDIESTNFGRVTGLTGTGSRQIQVNLRINF